MKLSSLTEWAKQRGISSRRARVLCATGRVRGAQKCGSYWLIPTDAKVKEAKGRWGH